MWVCACVPECVCVTDKMAKSCDLTFWRQPRLGRKEAQKPKAMPEIEFCNFFVSIPFLDQKLIFSSFFLLRTKITDKSLFFQVAFNKIRDKSAKIVKLRAYY